jgi:hypothetical protein
MPLPNITRTVSRPPPRIIISGAPKVGKTTLGASAPSPIFIRTEDGTNGMDVDAFDIATSYQAVIDQITALAKVDHQYQTVVIDALDGVERLIWHHVVECHNASGQKQIASIEDIGYAKGYIFALDFWARITKGLTYLRDKRGMTVVCICHSHQRKVTPPDLPEYERYEPRLHNKALGLMVEWADLIGFAAIETRVRTTDNNKTQGLTTGRRLLHCHEAAAWVAGNRYGINQSLDLSWSALTAAIGDNSSNNPIR